MINQFYCTVDQRFNHISNIDEISDIVAGKENLLWVDLDKPSSNELLKIAEEFNLHPLAVEDALRMHQRPKVDEYDSFYFVVFYACEVQEDFRLKTHEIAMFMGENYLITVHEEPIKVLEEASQRWKNNARSIESDIGVLLYSLIDAITDQYFPILETFEDRIEELESSIFLRKTRGAQGNYVTQMLELKRNLIALRRIIGPERDVLNVLTRRDSPIFSDRTRVYFQDVYDHLLRATEQVDTYRDLLNSAVDANLSMISLDLNQVMRTLTATSIILMSATLIAGVYGMNFQNMPELSWPAGYPLALAAMALVSWLIYIYFKRRHWF